MQNPTEGGAPPVWWQGTNRTIVLSLGGLVVAAAVLTLVFAAGKGAGAESDSSPGVPAATATQHGPQTVANFPPPAEVAPVGPQKAPTISEQAGALRRDATIQCRSGQWDKCLTDLDEAAKLDPEGDKIVVVQRLRKTAEQGRGN